MMRISKAGLDFIKGFESFVPYVYDDLVPAQRIGGKLVYREWKRGDPVKGTLTIGYGHTDAAKYDLGFDLCDVPAGFRLTEAEATHILDVDLDECEQAVNELVKVPITQGMFDALDSITFNFGIGNLKRSTLLAKLNRGDYEGARQAFDLYVFSKGKRLAGLQRRRDGEQVLWDSDVPPVPDEPVDHPADVDEDKTPPPPASMARSSEGNTAVVVGGAGGGYSLSNGAANAAAKTAASGHFSVWTFLLFLMSEPEFWVGAGVIAGAAYLWLRRRHKLVTLGV